jgi:YebC/PmpR family DNA-binding regulatory protein
MGRAHEVRAASMAKSAAVKSKLYSIYAKEIYQAAKSGGTSPDANPTLKSLIDKAKKDQIPSEVINRSIDKVSKGITEDYVALEYECFGPGGSTLIVKCLTDNVNRTSTFVRTAFTKTGVKMAAQGAVTYMYDYLCAVGFENGNEEEVLELMIENDIDVNDIENEEGFLTIYAEPSELNKIKKVLETKYKDIKFEIDEVAKFAKETIKLEGDELAKFERCIKALEDIEDVQNIYHNVQN